MTNSIHTYRIITSRQFRRDLRRIEKSGRYDLRKLNNVLQILKQGRTLPKQYLNHTLKGKYANYEECHITADWLLIYKRCGTTLVLQLTRTGRHTDLFME